MTQPIRALTRCENCGADIDTQSPPLQRYYKRGQIEIRDGTVLLDRPAKAIVHAAFLEGYYCNIECLSAHVKNLRAGKKSGAA